MRKVIAGTGHRPDKLGGYDNTLDFELLSGLGRAALRYLGANEVISGMALGWDQALANAADDASIPFIAYVPFAGQEFAWPKRTQADYQYLLKRASEVKIVCEGGYAAWKMQKRNKAMVNDATHILALWNGTDGGTANCIRYAKQNKKYIHNLWNTYEAIKNI